MEENKPINNPEVEHSEIPTLSGKTKPPNNEQQLNTSSTDEPIVTTAETSAIINPTSNIKEMEVHHHAHDPAAPHHKKNWKSYFWEFLMLFLAVFCGFLAEYQLEHKIERDRAKELAKSFYEELKIDSASVVLKSANRVKQEDALKYLIHYFKDSSLSDVSKPFVINFLYGINFRSPSIFEPRTVLLEQLKNSGALRYFKNNELQKLIGDLSVAINNINDRQALESSIRLEYINPIMIRHFDFDFQSKLTQDGKLSVFDETAAYEKNNEIISFHLKDLDKLEKQYAINILNNYCFNVLNSTRTLHFKKYSDINARLLKLLRKEYHLK